MKLPPPLPCHQKKELPKRIKYIESRRKWRYWHLTVQGKKVLIYLSVCPLARTVRSKPREKKKAQEETRNTRTKKKGQELICREGLNIVRVFKKEKYFICFWYTSLRVVQRIYQKSIQHNTAISVGFVFFLSLWIMLISFQFKETFLFSFFCRCSEMKYAIKCIYQKILYYF